MKRLSIGVLTVLLAAGLGLNAVAAPSNHASQGNVGPNAIAQASGGTAAAPPANFGSPPSGRYPILYNNHHVYAKPDTLRKGRVLAALVRGNTVLIPLRSMFQQMGATVKYNRSTKTVTISKPGASVKVTLGKPVVIINGESRPLDVPPMMYKGHILVPIRVLSEGMGAYVQWVPHREIVVVRYLPPTPPPPPATAPPPTPAPVATVAPTPTPAPIVAPYQDRFIVGDYILSPKVYNEFSPGNTGNNKRGGFSYAIRAASEFNLFKLPWMLEGDYRQYNYPHNCTSATDPQCMVTSIGTMTQTYVPSFVVRDYDFDGRLGLKVANPRIYVGVGYLMRTNNAGYPRQTGWGFGAEKLPDLNRPVSVYGSVWYYPTVKGTCGTLTCPTGPYLLSYSETKYQIGADFTFSKTSPIFLDLGFLGDKGTAKQNTPGGIGYTHMGPYVGLGIKF
ncbi:MAG: copper amine oxidase N-terminal domain-containing protein [Vulcanimicrobiaceae bacterium]